MIRSLFLLVMLLIIFSPQPGNTWESLAIPGIQYGRYEPGITVHLFGDRVNVRATPSTKGKVVANLPINTPLLIKAADKEVLTLHGLAAPWYQVQFTSAGKTGLAWVWGGLLSLVTVELGDATVLVGIKGKPRELEIRVARDSKLVTSQLFEGINLDDGGVFSYSVSGATTRLEYLPGQPMLVQIGFEYGACDYPNGEVMFTWNGKTLSPGPRETISSNEFGGNDFSLHFPGSVGVTPGTLKISRVTRQSEESGEETKITEQSETVWTWNGEKLVEKK